MRYLGGIIVGSKGKGLASTWEALRFVRQLSPMHPEWSAGQVFEWFTRSCPRCCGPMTSKDTAGLTKVCKDLTCGLECSYWSVAQLLEERREASRPGRYAGPVPSGDNVGGIRLKRRSQTKSQG